MEQKCPWDNGVCMSAAIVGRTDIIKWAMEHGRSLDVNVCVHAARVGNLDMLKWLREHDCPWDFGTCLIALVNGHFNVLKWALENGCELPNVISYSAANALELREITDMMHGNNMSVCTIALTTAHNDALYYLIGRGYTPNLDTYTIAIRARNLHLLRMLISNGSPLMQPHTCTKLKSEMFVKSSHG